MQSLDLLCMGQEDWDDVWRRNQHLLAGLARAGRTRRILFVEPPCDLSHALRSGKLFSAFSGQRNKLRQALGGARPEREITGLWLLTPFKLLPNSVPLLHRVNQWWERLQVGAALRALGMRRPVLWTQNPEAAHWLAFPDRSLSIYDATDDWSAMHGPARWVELVRRGQEQLARNSDLVLACSPYLNEKWARVNAKTHLLPNGVNVAHFERAGRLPLPPDVAALPRPVLGYIGTLHDERIDVDLVTGVAGARPDWQFLFIGPNLLSGASLARLKPLANVHLIGPRPYRDLPAYMGAFDVCILPHRVTLFTESLDPIKLYEYLASGLPIVSTSVGSVRDFVGDVSLAGDPGQFVAQVEAALTKDDEVARRRRRDLAQGSSWNCRVAALQRILQGSLAGDGVMIADRTTVGASHQ